MKNLCPFNFRLKCHLIMMAFGYIINERKTGHLNKRGCKLRSEKMWHNLPIISGMRSKKTKFIRMIKKQSQSELKNCRTTKVNRQKINQPLIINELAQSRNCIRIFTLNKYPYGHKCLPSCRMRDVNKRNSFHILIRYSCVTIIMIHNHKNKRYFLWFFLYLAAFLRGTQTKKNVLFFHPHFPFFFFQFLCAATAAQQRDT